MKVILQNAIAINGMIAGPNEDTSWISNQDWNCFLKLVKKIGVMIVGRTTYDEMMQSDEHNNYSDILTVVLTKNSKIEKEEDNLIITTKSPKQVLEMLNNRGFKEVLIAGGGNLNKSFVKQNLVDEIYIDVHPLILGRGTPVFTTDKFRSNLILLNSRKLSKNVIQLHYKVVK